MTKAIRYLCKVFSEKTHAEGFRSGHILIKTLDQFRGVEDASRADPHEGVCSVHQPDGLTLLVGGHIIRGTELPGPVRVSSHRHRSLPVLCMYAGVVEAGAMTTLDDLQMPARCRKWGDWVVALTNAEEFARRLEGASGMAGFTVLSRGLVEYYNPDLINGQFKDDEAPFQKEKSFGDESEYRFVFGGYPGAPAPTELKTGDMCDISLLTTIDDFNNGIEFVPHA